MVLAHGARSESLEQSPLWSRELLVFSVSSSELWEVSFPLDTVSVTYAPPESEQEMHRKLRGHLAADSICTLTF